MSKLRVGILGATGMVGQRFVQLLEAHPQFEVTALAASDRSQGKTYAEACTWRLPGEMPELVKKIVVQSPAPPLDCDFVFSSLPGEIAGEAEERFARAGFPVLTNSSSHRMDADVPPLIGGEEEKSESETVKILGRVAGATIKGAKMKVSAQCNRVNVIDGHLAAMRVKLAQPASLDQVREALTLFSSLPQELKLP